MQPAFGTTGAKRPQPATLQTAAPAAPPLLSSPLLRPSTAHPRPCPAPPGMSFQNFRLPPPGPQHAFPDLDTPPHSALSGPSSSSLSPPFASLSSDSTTRVQSPSAPPGGSGGGGAYADSTRKGLYGSGDADDRYTLVFQTMDAFEAWRRREEEEKMVEFVKGDTHASKAVPPRFKEHTKLVCGRHSRGGRKKYVKKYPDRVRKVPSRKVRPLRFVRPWAGVRGGEGGWGAALRVVVGVGLWARARARCRS